MRKNLAWFVAGFVAGVGFLWYSFVSEEKQESELNQ